MKYQAIIISCVLHLASPLVIPLYNDPLFSMAFNLRPFITSQQGSSV